MKKIFGLIVSIIVGVLSVSCKSDTPPDPHSGSIKSYKYELEKTGELLSKLIVYFDEKDKESIKALFSAYARQNYDLDSQIEKVFEIYDGKSKSFEIRNGDELSKEVKKGGFWHKCG